MDGRTGCLWLVTNKYARDETFGCDRWTAERRQVHAV